MSADYESSDTSYLPGVVDVLLHVEVTTSLGPVVSVFYKYLLILIILKLR